MYDLHLQSSNMQPIFIYDVQDFEGYKHWREEIILCGLGKGEGDIIRDDISKRKKSRL